MRILYGLLKSKMIVNSSQTLFMNVHYVLTCLHVPLVFEILLVNKLMQLCLFMLKACSAPGVNRMLFKAKYFCQAAANGMMDGTQGLCKRMHCFLFNLNILAANGLSASDFKRLGAAPLMSKLKIHHTIFLLAGSYIMCR